MDYKSEDLLKAMFTLVITLFVSPFINLIPAVILAVAWQMCSSDLAVALGSSWPTQFGFWSALGMSYVLFTVTYSFTSTMKTFVNPSK